MFSEVGSIAEEASLSDAETGIDWENSEWKTPEQIAGKAEYILIVKKAGQSAYLYHTILTPVEVLHVFKSNGEDFSGKPLFLYEPSFVEFEQKRYYPHNSYNRMQDKAEYLVFLNRRVVPEGYTPTDTEKNSYLFTTNCALPMIYTRTFFRLRR